MEKVGNAKNVGSVERSELSTKLEGKGMAALLAWLAEKDADIDTNKSDADILIALGKQIESGYLEMDLELFQIVGDIQADLAARFEKHNQKDSAQKK